MFVFLALFIGAVWCQCEGIGSCPQCQATGGCAWCVGGILHEGKCVTIRNIGNDGANWETWACNPGRILGGPILVPGGMCKNMHHAYIIRALFVSVACFASFFVGRPSNSRTRKIFARLFVVVGVQVQPAYPSGDDCRALSGMCQVCNSMSKFDGFYAGTFKCKFCSASSSSASSQVRPGCYAHDTAVGPACIGQSAASAMARQGSGLTEDPNCKSTYNNSR
jgi:hypothetical protein